MCVQRWMWGCGCAFLGCEAMRDAGGVGMYGTVMCEGRRKRGYGFVIY